MEEYIPIKSYPKYEVSRNGNIRRIGKHSVLKPIDNGTGYKTVHLSNDKGRRLCLIHRIVLTTYNPIEENKDVNHIDGDKSNNSLNNLEWVSKSENTRHAHTSGLFKSRNKLTIGDVKFIKGNRMVPAKELAVSYGVQASVIYKIWNGSLYPYV